MEPVRPHDAARLLMRRRRRPEWAARGPPASRQVAATVIFALVCAQPVAALGQNQSVEEILREPFIEFNLDVESLDDIEILINGQLANAFAALEQGQVRFGLPFPATGEPIRLEVVRADTGETLFTQTYRFAPATVFDRQDFSFTALEIAEARPLRRLSPEPDDGGYRGAENDFLVTGKYSGLRGNWSVGADGEISGATDRTRRVRDDGPAVDMRDGSAFLAYDEQGAGGQLTVGDLDVLSGTALVIEGYRSRGIGLATSLFDDRLTVAGSSTFGTDIVGLQHGFGQSSESNRFAADVGLEVVRSSDANVKLTGSFLDAERPPSSNFGVGEVVEGEKNRVLGGGLAINLFGGRISTTSNFASSRYENPAEFDPVLNALPGFYDVGVTTGRAHTHRADLVVWQEESFNVLAFGGYSLIDPLYRSIQSYAEADRETIEFGGFVGWGPAGLDLGYQVFENNVDDAPAILTTKQKTTSATLTLSLEAYRAPIGDSNGLSWGTQLIPSAISLAYADSRVTAENAAAVLADPRLFYTLSDIPNQVLRSASVNFSWSWPNGSTDITLATNRLDNRPPSDTTADMIDKSIDVAQTLFGDVWDLTAYVTASQARAGPSTNTSKRHFVAPGMSFSLRLEDWPDFTGYVDATWDTTDFGVDDSDSHARTRRVGASLDFSKYLPVHATDPLGALQPFAVVSWQFQDTKLHDPYFGEQSQISHTAMFTVGFQIGP